MNAWPATHQMLIDGWLIRLSNGYTKRANCVVPLYQPTTGGSPHSATTPEQQLDKIRYCENLYAREQLKTVFRLTSLAPNATLDHTLADRGYQLLDATRVQVANLRTTTEAANSLPQPAIEFQLVAAPEWLRAYSRLAEMPAAASELHANLIRSIRPDCAFALLTDHGEPVSCGLGVVEHDLLGLFDVITSRARRSQGLGKRMLTQLLQWGAQQGAEQAYLQVVADNSPALALYDQLGFSDLYRYWYRQSS